MRSPISLSASLATIFSAMRLVSAVDEASVPAVDEATMPWPVELPGWGHLRINRTEFAIPVVDSGVDMDTLDKLPEVYTVERAAPTDTEGCTNPYEFPDTGPVTGIVCLPDGVEYEAMVADQVNFGISMVELASNVNTVAAAKLNYNGCTKCNHNCIYTLMFYPACSKFP